MISQMMSSQTLSLRRVHGELTVSVRICAVAAALSLRRGMRADTRHARILLPPNPLARTAAPRNDTREVRTLRHVRRLTGFPEIGKEGMQEGMY